MEGPEPDLPVLQGLPSVLATPDPVQGCWLFVYSLLGGSTSPSLPRKEEGTLGSSLESMFSWSGKGLGWGRGLRLLQNQASALALSQLGL